MTGKQLHKWLIRNKKLLAIGLMVLAVIIAAANYHPRPAPLPSFNNAQDVATYMPSQPFTVNSNNWGIKWSYDCSIAGDTYDDFIVYVYDPPAVGYNGNNSSEPDTVNPGVDITGVKGSGITSQKKAGTYELYVSSACDSWNVHVVDGNNKTTINNDRGNPTKVSPVSNNQPSQTATAAENAQAAGILTAATDFYANLYQQGLTALGTQQYSDASVGLDALNDPTSAASTWSTFNQNMQKTDYYTQHVLSAYNNASNIYPDGAQPSSLSDWNNDMNQADSDLHQWTQQATSWQISGITTDQLNGYANTFNKDLAQARADIAKL